MNNQFHQTTNQIDLSTNRGLAATSPCRTPLRPGAPAPARLGKQAAAARAASAACEPPARAARCHELEQDF